MIFETLAVQDQDEIAKRLGLMNFWNPLQPGCNLDLELHLADERRLAATLITLAGHEEVDATPRSARGLGHPQPIESTESSAKGKGAPKRENAADLLPSSGTVNIAYEAERETARLDVHLLLARESYLVGQLVPHDVDDDVSIQRLKLC